MINLLDEESRKGIAEFIKCETDRLEYNKKIFTILGGNLKTLLQQKMLEDLGPKSFAAAQFRQAPINIFKKIMDKITRIYQDNVVRTVEGGNDADAKLVQWYEEQLNLDSKFSKNNENFNAFLYSLLQIGLTDLEFQENPNQEFKKPFVRTIPNHQFLVMNVSSTDPTSADVVIVCMPKRKNPDGTYDSIYYVYTKYQFVIMNQQGEIQSGMMADKELDGTNPYGVNPFSYANASQDCVMPDIQTDNLDMSLLIPLLLTDLNYAVKFQAFSVFVAIGLKNVKAELSPNCVIEFDVNPAADKSSFETLKPTVDITEVLSLAASQMSLWLSSKSVRPTVVAGDLGVDSFASGISKIIDEADTYEALKWQITVYKKFEADFWERLLRHMHPQWVAAGVIENKTIFSAGARVVTKFATPSPMQTRGELVKQLDEEGQAGFISKKRALKKLNPEMTDDDIADLLKEIDDETPVIIPMGGNGFGSEQGNAAQAESA